MTTDELLEERLVRRACLGFDAEDAAWPDDEALLARVEQRLLTSFEAPLPSRRPWWMWGLGGSVIGLLALAGAISVAGRSEKAPERPVVAVTAPPVASAAPVASSTAVSALPAPVTTVQPGPQPTVDQAPPVAPVPAASLVTRRAAAPSAEPNSESAAELFARANRARREGATQEAIDTYRRVTQRFAQSPEALASEVPLGMLELKAGHGANAGADFDAYLRRAPQGALAPEALWGRAQAELQQGKTSAARQSLESLLKSYPSSAYADSARAKLEAISK